MRHPSDGTLRRLVDEPAGVADADREHVAGCQACLTGLAAARRDAASAGAALDVRLATDVDAGWRRLAGAAAAATTTAATTAAATTTGPITTAPQTSSRPAPAARRRRLRSPAVAALGVAAVLTAGSAAAAGDWLQIFRTERVAQVRVTEADLVALPDLSGYGDLRITEEVDVRRVADADAAARATGLSVPRVDDLPRGVTGTPTHQVLTKVGAEFTFSAEKAARTAGGTLPPPPAGLDGSTFRLEAGPGLATAWPQSRGVPALVVARAVAPTAYSSGIPFTVARDYLLSLPGISESLATQLRGFTGDGSTLPLPVPAEYVTTRAADVGGAPATVFTSRDGVLAGVVWVEDGVVTAVAGSVDDDEALAVARGLRPAR